MLFKLSQTASQFMHFINLQTVYPLGAFNSFKHLFQHFSDMVIIAAFVSVFNVMVGHGFGFLSFSGELPCGLMMCFRFDRPNVCISAFVGLPIFIPSARAGELFHVSIIRLMLCLPGASCSRRL